MRCASHADGDVVAHPALSHSSEHAPCAEDTKKLCVRFETSDLTADGKGNVLSLFRF